MIKKGVSRKGQRRRQVIAATGAGAEEDIDLRPPPNEEPVKLDLATTGIVKKIPRIEPTLRAVEEIRVPQHNEMVWGHQHKSTSSRWVWLSFSIAIAVMFTAIAIVNRRSSQNAGSSSGQLSGIAVISDDLDKESPLDVFQENPYQTRLDAIDILRKVAVATKSQQILPLIRQLPDTQALLTKNWKPWPSPPLFDDADQWQSDIDETSGTAFFLLHGTHQDGSPLLAFFVKENDMLLLDWEATMQLGEARLSTLAKLPTTNPVSMRVILSPSPYYLPTLPENDYESFKITNLQEDTIVWGYVRRGSPAHQQITDLLYLDSKLLEAISSMRATVKLRRTDDVNSQNRFFLTEMLHKDWVMP